MTIDDSERAVPHDGEASMSTSTAQGSSLALGLSRERNSGSRVARHDVNGQVDADSDQYVSDERPSDAVIALREWGTSRRVPLYTPNDSRRTALPDTAAERPADEALALTTSRVELVYEGQSWRVRDWNGIAQLKQDGRGTCEATLMPGTEITIAGKTLIAESPRSIALRNFCARLLGWADDRIPVVDQALRSIRLASSARAALMLRGSGDLIPVAYTIHRHALGRDVPFIVCDPRRKNTPETVRGPANFACCSEALQPTFHGTICVRAQRLPPDFDEVLRVFREPNSRIQVMVCSAYSEPPARDTSALGVAPIDVPSLETRRADLPRIVSEYIEDTIDALHAPHDCVHSTDVDWIIARAYFANRITIPGIEKAVLRTVALRMSGNLTRASALLDMARVSLERWFARRNGDPQ